MDDRSRGMHASSGERGRFATREELIAAIKSAPRIDSKRFREDIDEWVDQSIAPRL